MVLSTVIRSAVSSTHAPLEGSPIGQHPLVSQLLRGIYNSRPPRLRYTCTWDVDVVVQHLKGLGNNADLSLKTLSGKLTLLMALTLASRRSELQALDLRFKPEGVLFRLASLTKKRKVGSSPKECFFTTFVEDRSLCVVQCLQRYEKITHPFRQFTPGDPQSLFLSYVKPHNPVTSPTAGSLDQGDVISSRN